MLTRLTVRDFALVRAVDVTFDRGLTVLTGESGAGKSILLGALGLALGDRASAASVRPSAERSDVTAEFDVDGNRRAARFSDLARARRSRCAESLSVAADHQSRGPLPRVHQRRTRDVE